MNIIEKIKWKQYNEQSKNKPIRPLLLKALTLFGQYRGSVIDIGCGIGRESAYLYIHGWDILAIDGNADGLIDLKREYADIQTYNVLFENLSELPQADLIFADFSIPFCNPQHFDKFLDVLLNAIKENGRFAGSFFGPNDDWAPSSKMSFCNVKIIKSLFINLEIEYLNEVEYERKTLAGQEKHWHVIEVIAKKSI